MPHSVLPGTTAVDIRGRVSRAPRRPAASLKDVASFEAGRVTITRTNEEELDDVHAAWLESTAVAVAHARDLAERHPDSPIGWVRLSQIAWQGGNVDEARQASERALELVGAEGPIPAAYAAITILIASGGHEDATRHLLRLPRTATLAVVLAGLQMDAGQTEEALATLAGVATATAATLRGYIYLKAYKPERAIAELRQAMRTSAPDADSLIYLSQAYLGIGSPIKALRYARQAALVAPGRRDVTYYLLQSLLDRGLFDSAENEVKKVIALGVVEPPDFLVLRAKIAQGQGNVSRALTMLKRARAASTDDGQRAEMDANIARLRQWCGEITAEEMLKALRAACKRAPTNLLVAIMLTESLPNCSDVPELEQVLERLRQAGHPENALLPIRTALAYLRTDFEDALSLAKAWSENDSESVMAASMAAMLTGQISEDWETAAALAMKCLDDLPNSEVLGNECAYILALGGKPNEALSLLDSVNCQLFVPAATRGLALLAAGSLDDGLRQYREAASLADAQDPEGRGRVLMTIHQATAIRRLGLEDSAVELLRAAALPVVDLPQGWQDSPAFRLLESVAQRHEWPWPVVIA